MNKTTLTSTSSYDDVRRDLKDAAAEDAEQIQNRLRSGGRGSRRASWGWGDGSPGGSPSQFFHTLAPAERGPIIMPGGADQAGMDGSSPSVEFRLRRGVLRSPPLINDSDSISRRSRDGAISCVCHNRAFCNIHDLDATFVPRSAMSLRLSVTGNPGLVVELPDALQLVFCLGYTNRANHLSDRDAGVVGPEETAKALTDSLLDCAEPCSKLDLNSIAGGD